MKISFLAECFPILEKELLKEIEVFSTLKKYKAKDLIVKQGSYIKSLPIVITGNVKVFSNEDTIQFLLYNISPGKSCIFSFAHTLNKEPAEFSAVAEIDSELLLLPIYKVNVWLRKYPSFANLVLLDYQKHYKDLLETTKQVICYNLDQRLLKFLENKSQIEGSDTLHISHQDIANELGTSREVITRVLKKLNHSNSVIQIGRKIKIL
ncbi:Crp/Fnr family transcriptional regulator [uncultured Winogradskyella sp.]|uniref:Crp/Fnr family transcriptional regulator n=1 Tax=uncultured Winogradskyella sp. TaxID=395353 RepID=UPI00260B7F39|nr:Crp/Fnr family transcriptional regulator [uncultured Winogradskyella sp.]